MDGNGHCTCCSLPRLLGGETSSRCSLCLRFRVSAALLTSSSFCSCFCACYGTINEAEDAVADDVTDSDYEEQADDYDETLDTSPDNDNHDGFSVASRQTRTSSISSTYSDRYAIDNDEFFQLVHGLNFWEIHDVELVSGFSQNELIERFPEVEHVHGRRRQEDEPPSPIPTFCQDCQRPLFREVVEAIDRGLVSSCEGCLRPLLAAENAADGLPTHEDFDRCRCRCLCEELEEDKVEPCYMPFLCNNRYIAPASWVRDLLEERGFCLADSCTDGGFCSMIEQFNLPTLSQIRNHTYRDDCRRHMDEAGLAYQHYLDSSTFPNGVVRDRSTDSGLPQVVENYFRSIDPGAFGHEASTRPLAPAPDRRSRWEELEVPDGLLDDGAPPSQHDMERNSRLISLHCWINQNEWRLEEDDAVRFCTADDLGIDRDRYDSDLYVTEDSDQVSNAATSHDYRHLYRRYERIVQLGGHQARPEDLEYVVQSELEYHDFLDFIDNDNAPLLNTEHPAVTGNPFPHPEELRQVATSADEAALGRARAQMQDVLADQPPVSTMDTAMFDILQQMQMEWPRTVIIGGPVQRADTSPDMYGELPGPLRRVMVGPGMTVLIEEDELDLTDAIFVNNVEDSSGPGPAVDAENVEVMDVDWMN